jgi:hypothetical protein
MRKLLLSRRAPTLLSNAVTAGLEFPCLCSAFGRHVRLDPVSMQIEDPPPSSPEMEPMSTFGGRTLRRRSAMDRESSSQAKAALDSIYAKRTASAEPSLAKASSAKPYYMRREFFKYSHERIEGQEAIVSQAVHSALAYSTYMDPGPAMTRQSHSAPATPMLSFSSTGRKRGSTPSTPAWDSRPATPSSTLINSLREAARPKTPVGHFKRRFLGDGRDGRDRAQGASLPSRAFSSERVSGSPATLLRTSSETSAAPSSASRLEHGASRLLTPGKQALVAQRSLEKAKRKSSVIVGNLCQVNELKAPWKGATVALPSTSPHLYNIWVGTKQRLVSAGDPDCDFSWSVPDPDTYTMLPRKAMDMQDWRAFSIIMCDLRFLVQKIDKHGVQSILQVYDQAWVALEKQGAVTGQLQDYRNFVTAQAARLEVPDTPVLTRMRVARALKMPIAILSPCSGDRTQELVAL